jgi:hypothetical protein
VYARLQVYDAMYGFNHVELSNQEQRRVSFLERQRDTRGGLTVWRFAFVWPTRLHMRLFILLLLQRMRR